MKRKYVSLVVPIVIMCLCLVVILAGGWGLYGRTENSLQPVFFNDPPIVKIINPEHATIIASGEGLMLSAIAVSDSGLSLVELRVDGVIAQEKRITVSGIQTIDVVFPWFASRTGWQELSVVAYDVRGRASEPAIIQVGVKVVDLTTSEIENSPETGGILPAGNLPQPDPNAGSPQEEIPALPLQPQDDQSLPDQPFPELPPQPQDNIPIINNFEISVLNLVANGAGIRIYSKAADDMGIQRMVLHWRKIPGQGNDLSQLCGLAAECTMDQIAFFVPGQYLLSVQAFDTSGQASEMKAEWVEVIGAPDQPPAVADQGFDFNWEQPGLMDDVAERLGNVDLNAGFGVDEFLDDLFGGEPEQDEEQFAEGQCANITVNPQAEGNLVTLTVRCDMQVEAPDGFLYPHVSKHLVNAGNDGGIDLRIPEWYNNQRFALSSGEVFTWLDDDVTCAMAYRYGVRVDLARESQQGLGVSQNLAFASAETFTPACAPGTLGDMDLHHEVRMEGINILWTIAQNGNWPANLPNDGVTFTLTRFEPVSGETLEIYRENIPPALLLSGGDYSVLDHQVQCGNEYWYTLAAIAADVDLHLVSPGWLVRSQTHIPVSPCPAEDLGSIELRLSPYWFNESYIRMRLQMELPPGFNWPQGDHIHLAIMRTLQGSDCAGQPCWEVMTDIPITEAVRASGLAYEDDDTDVAPGRKTYVYRLSLRSELAEIQSGASFSAITPPAPPLPPEILRLTAANNCPAGVPRCVAIEWQLYEQSRMDGPYAQAAQIAVERVVGAIDQQIFPVGIGDTSYVDLLPFMNEVEMANGQVRRLCRWTTNYRMIAFDAEGHTFGASPLTIDMPDCNAPLNIVVEPR